MQTTEAVHMQQQAFIDAAVRYWEAGFDGVEINASCNHYFSTFLSRFANNERTDQYSGASIENRCRIITEIIEGIRAQVGQDFIIQVLYSGVEGRIDELGRDELCTTVEEACEMARLFERAGASCLHIRSQLYGHHSAGFMPDILHYCEHGDTGYASVIDYRKHFGGALLGQYEGFAALLDMAARIKSSVDIPVGIVGAVDPRATPDLIDSAIRDGKIDYILMTRALMADMALPNKLKEGRRDEIAPCVRCMTCFVAPFGIGQPMYCRVNPALTNAFDVDMPEGYDPLPAAGHLSVMVVGAGPAGMEAARIAAQRGYKVTLYEKREDVAGLMNLAMSVKGPHERIIDHKDYLKRQLEVQGVTLVKNKEVDLAFIQEEAPDVVVIAVGGLCDTLPFSASGTVISIEDFYKGTVSIDEVPQNIVIYGAQLLAADLAEHFLKIGRKVTILNPGPEDEVLQDAPVWPKMMGREWLHTKGARIYNNVVVQSAENGMVTFDTEYGTTETLPFDALINGMSLQPNRELYDAIREMTITKTVNDTETSYTPEAYAVGDCHSPSNIAHATQRANVAARQIGSGSAEADEPLGENQYRGTAVGFGDLSVTITVESGSITAAKVNTSQETVGYARHLGEQFAPQIVAKGDIDAVSGATVTCDAVQDALAQAKSQAGL
ncbi:MAG: FAD-dependent oxidoreductase [Coriobacteriales bacterium]|jgi:2,4-dienoyl-CoA reductase-like NADH-dependent reductase (Old Yellow Enzyme family)/pyruvate/2-oxoglutarate dehydrogenase complex dihydrolipoamide dehydrogenase (E3) component|nr:FAD-dependent oxidoreductase [Coriobacteriales bacterium]